MAINGPLLGEGVVLDEAGARVGEAVGLGAMAGVDTMVGLDTTLTLGETLVLAQTMPPIPSARMPLPTSPSASTARRETPVPAMVGCSSEALLRFCRSGETWAGSFSLPCPWAACSRASANDQIVGKLCSGSFSRSRNS